MNKITPEHARFLGDENRVFGKFIDFVVKNIEDRALTGFHETCITPWDLTINFRLSENQTEKFKLLIAEWGYKVSEGDKGFINISWG